MPLRRATVVFGLGAFALVAQTVLFRQFFTVFEGNELGVGCFFGSWLLWVAAGAGAARGLRAWHAGLTRRFELVVLLYLPAFFVQQAAIAHVRALAGVEAYDLFPVLRMSAFAFLVNAPVSFLTGGLFTLACRWSEEHGGAPPARVYVVETLGGCLGGVGVTALLVLGCHEETALLWAALVLCLGLCGARYGRWLRFVPAAACAGALLAGLGGAWADHNSRAQWARLLPAAGFEGAFTTAQGRYLFGRHGPQFVLLSGAGVCEALPSRESASEMVAIHLAQHPEAKRVLVIGTGAVAACAKFAEMPQVERVTWLHPDPEYPRRLGEVLPDEFAPWLDLVDAPGMDARSFLAATRQTYDLIVIHLPDVTTLALNSYSTREFLELCQAALGPSGVLSVRISGGENYLGGELAYLGSSMLATLDTVFRHVVLKPGGESWLTATNGGEITAFAGELAARFEALEGARRVYPPEGLLSLYPADRIAFQLAAYRQVIDQVDESVLVNTDRRPKALLYGLLVALRHAGGRSYAGAVPVLLACGLWLAMTPALVYGMLRWLYLARVRRRGPGQRPFDGQFLVFSTGLVGMALSVVLMFLYQGLFGALFLHMGLISALYMLGAFASSALCERYLSRHDDEPRILLLAVIATHLAVAGLIALAPDPCPRAHFALLFLLCGAGGGIYFPLAAHRLARAGRNAAAAGANLETLDHLGGAIGGAATGLVLLPLLGASASVAAIALLLAVNLGAPLTRGSPRRPRDAYDRRVRPAGYVLAGMGLWALLSSHLVAVCAQAQSGVRQAALEMTGGAAIEACQAELDDGTAWPYYDVPDTADGPGGYVFGTSVPAGDIAGYGGPIHLAVYVGRQGVLRDLRVARSNETPAYLRRLDAWLEGLAGRDTTLPGAFGDVDAVSGATMTCDAIIDILTASGRAFGAAVLGTGAGPPVPARRRAGPDRAFVCLTVFMAGAIALRRRPHPWVRRAFLLASVGILGVGLNAQYATYQVVGVLSGQVPRVGLTGPLFLMVMVPAMVALFGNVYCGYVCPFGALQELLGDLRPKRLATDPAKGVWRYGRAVKYGLLLLLVPFALTRDYAVLGADPLLTVFSSVRDRFAWLLAGAVLMLSIVFRRFWCRNLCPAGAFLALVNGFPFARHLRPAVRPANCDVGVRSGLELDCLDCDRCRHGT